MDPLMAAEGCASVLPRASDLIVFGDYDVAEGGGATPWLAVRQRDGNVLGVDVERKVPLFSLNSSLNAFIDTFCLLDQFLGRGLQVPANVDVLARALDPSAYDGSDWRHLVSFVLGA